MNQLINQIMVSFVGHANTMLMPAMVAAFCIGVGLRGLIYYTVRRELWFVREFEKRLYARLEAETENDGMPFHKYLRRVLERTYYEVFELRARYRRRNPDFIMSLSDRLFLVQDGAARLIRDTMKFLRHYERRENSPAMIEISKNIFNMNPAFSRVFGIVPASAINTILDMLPGLFIIAGIFGTFIGIMNALPQLSGMDLTNADQTKSIMDGFLVQMAYALVTSILGIVLSVTLNIFNSVCDPEGLFITIVDRYSSALTVVWNRCNAPANVTYYEETDDDFDDSDELAAHECVQRQLARADVRLTWRDGAFVPQPFQPQRPEGDGSIEAEEPAAETAVAAAPAESEAPAAAEAAAEDADSLDKKKSA